jgi:flagellar protein FliL
MAQNSKSAAQKPQDPTVPVKSSKKLVMGIIVSMALIIAAGAAWYFTKGKQHDAGHVEEVKVEAPKTPIFVPLEMFTVNLQRESTDQYLQLGLSLKVFESDYEAKIKLNQPEIRSKILQLLTTKTATELLSAEGKSKLVKEIITLGNSVIGIVEAPLPPAIAAASQVAAAPVEAPAHAAEAASAPVPNPATPAPAAKKGIVDVLFTSFIIQ